MEDEWIADRARLRTLWQTHPAWRIREYATTLKRSPGWVSKWLGRLQTAPPHDDAILHSRSRAPKHPHRGLSQPVMEAILTARRHPPQNLRRTPGPKALLYYLAQDASLAGHHLPRSTRTVYNVLKAANLIPTRPRRRAAPWELPNPMEVWELDFTDNPYARCEEDGKQQHRIEILVSIDTGTSILLDLCARDDFTAETAIQAVVRLIQKHGLPRVVRFDRDPRFVGSPQQGDFPAAFVRFWLCLGVQVDICEPHRPQDKPFVERVNGTVGTEGLAVERPTTVATTDDCMTTLDHHYNYERPHQGRACRNLPPRVAFPNLPALPPVPEQVDPDAWLPQIDGLRITRVVGKDGGIAVNKHAYYAGKALWKQRVGVRVDAAAQELVIEQDGQEHKRCPLKGLQRSGPIAFDTWVQQVQGEARAEHRQQRTPRGRSSGTRSEAPWITTLRAAVKQVAEAEGKASEATAPPSSVPAVSDAEWAQVADEMGAPPF